MPPAPIVGLIILLMTAGCAGIGHAPPREPAETGAGPDAPVAAKPPEAAAKQEEGAAVKPPEAQAAQVEAVQVEPATIPAVPPVADSPGKGRNGSSTPTAKSDGPTTKVDEPATKTPAKVAATPAPAEPARKKEVAAPPSVKPPAAPLDLALLEKRLKETNAIGVFTKLTLKNQVDDLLSQFRAYYEGRVKTRLADLRQPYDLLILKVLALLQDRDPSLANAILASREEIWGILTDPVRFSTL